MITKIEALNYRCLRYVSVPVKPFQVLVGPNGSGKTTLLGVVTLLGSLASHRYDIESVVLEQAPNFPDLTFHRAGTTFELAVEAAIPIELREKLWLPQANTIRYEVAVGLNPESNAIEVHHERLLLFPSSSVDQGQLQFFPRTQQPPANIVGKDGKSLGGRMILNRVREGNDNFYSEVEEKPWTIAYKLGRRKSIFGNLPDDESNFPVSTWFRNFLTQGCHPMALNGEKLREMSPPGKGRQFRPDGSNLPWVIEDFEKRSPERFKWWIDHLRTALPDFDGITTDERPDTKHRWLVLRHPAGFNVPSWVASDGTLRLLALTLPAYLPDQNGIYLIEEPENGIHPRAIEALVQSLSSVYDAQILVATHSTLILSLMNPDQILCFAKRDDGSTDVVPGNEHPALQDWQKGTNLATLFATGVLG